MKGLKYDQEKPRCGLVFKDFAHALKEVSKVGTFGATKYGVSNWLLVDNGIERYTNALYRHLLDETDNILDKETELLHAAHVAWNALARLELIIREQQDAPVTAKVERLRPNIDISETECY